MKVYLRHESSTEGFLLTECDAMDIRDLVLDMREEGVFYENGMYHDLIYQYVLTDTDAFAEIILTGEAT